jgi:hypothetical protein
MNKDETPGVLSRASCIEFEAELAAYLEGEGRPALAAHVAQCDYCQCLLADMEQIRTVSPDLMEDPPPRMWSNIREVLVEEGVIGSEEGFWQRWVPGWGSGILRHRIPLGVVVAAVLVAVFFPKMPGRAGHQLPAQLGITREAMSGAVSSSSVSELRHTVSGLQRAYDANMSRIDPSMKATYQRSLESLNEEIRDCRESLPGDPGGLTQYYLATAYMQKAELLQSALEYDLR